MSKNNMENISSKLAMFFAKQYFKAYRKNHPTVTMVFIRGIGNDYPNFLVYSRSESWTKELSDLCDS